MEHSAEEEIATLKSRCADLEQELSRLKDKFDMLDIKLGTLVFSLQRKASGEKHGR